VSFPSSAGSDRVFALRSGRGAIALEADGLRHPRALRFLGETVTPYADITHHVLSLRGLRLATRKSVYLFPRSGFVDPRAPDELVRLLMERIGAAPGAAAQLDRMWAVEKLAARRGRPRLGLAVAALCAAVMLAELAFGPLVRLSGFFSAPLVRGGEWWRLVTANFLHAGLGHLLLNAIGLVVIGGLVERALGAARTVPVLAAGVLGGMGASVLAGYSHAVGASGVVFGLVGALLWLELRWPERLPAPWRIPRTILIGALVADTLLGLALPAIAGAAHLGGFVAGMAACACVGGPRLERRSGPAWVWAVNGLAIFGLAVAFGAAGAIVAGGAHGLAGRARMLAERADISPLDLNNLAWMIATDPAASEEDRGVAVELAERAVELTGRGDPNVLDTLAEAEFAAGHEERALRTIDEAIALAPREPYLQEQRRRFAGERAPDDRPDEPDGWILPEPSPDDPVREEPEDGLRV
jgi:membrane associated rhomboid family serine protease